MQRLTIVGMAAVIAAGAAGGLGAGALAGCTVRREQPNLVGQDIRLTLIHTSDIHSRLFPYNFVPNTFDQGYGLLPSNAPFRSTRCSHSKPMSSKVLSAAPMAWCMSRYL